MTAEHVTRTERIAEVELELSEQEVVIANALARSPFSVHPIRAGSAPPKSEEPPTPCREVHIRRDEY